MIKKEINLESNLSENEIFEKFKKLIIINKIHDKQLKIDLNHRKEDEDQMAKAEFYSFISIIIKPEDENKLVQYFYMLFEKFDMNFFFSLFNKEDDEDKINMETIMKLKKILEEVF